jgi:hypothetical protein
MLPIEKNTCPIFQKEWYQMNRFFFRIMRKYTTILQKPNCCAIACLMMIIYRHTGKLYEQEELAHRFGVKIGEQYREAFSREFGTYSSLGYDEGVNTREILPQIQDFLRKEKIPLTVEIMNIETLEELYRCIRENSNEETDIWCEYII